MGKPKHEANDKLRYSYHKDKGHLTANCRAFKDFLEEMVIAGHLTDFIDEEKTVAQPNQQHQPRFELRTINVIHGMVDQCQEDHLRVELA